MHDGNGCVVVRRFELRVQAGYFMNGTKIVVRGKMGKDDGHSFRVGIWGSE